MIIKEEVERMMLKDPRTKDCDNWLIFSIWKEHGFDLGVTFEQAKNMTSAESITRPRRKLQESGEKELQSSKKVKEKREKREKEFRESYGRKNYNPSLMKNSQYSW